MAKISLHSEFKEFLRLLTTKMSDKKNRFPKGWDEKRVKEVLEHYENQTEDEALAEDEAAYEDTTHTFLNVPTELLPEIRELLVKRCPS